MGTAFSESALGVAPPQARGVEARAARIGIGVDDALAMAEHVDVWNCWAAAFKANARPHSQRSAKGRRTLLCPLGLRHDHPKPLAIPHGLAICLGDRPFNGPHYIFVGEIETFSPNGRCQLVDIDHAALRQLFSNAILNQGN
jgi:hypothetical protein